MSVSHPVISVVGSSGEGTSTVKHTFDQIFRREGIKDAAALSTLDSEDFRASRVFSGGLSSDKKRADP